MGARLGSSWISARVKLLPSRLLIQAAPEQFDLS